MPQSTIRSFIALELPDASKEHIVTAQTTLRQTLSIKGSWVTQPNIHLTLQFLGNIQTEKINPIIACMRSCLNNTPTIQATVHTIGTFPERGKPRIVWAGIEHGREEITKIVQCLSNSLQTIGFTPERRSFKTHVTICRVRSVLNRSLFQETIDKLNRSFTPAPCTIERITLFQSTLSAQGPHYTSLYTHQLIP